MKKLMFILVFLTSLVFAIPSQQDIQTAMINNNTQHVIQLSKAVLAEHPNSALAHFYLAQGYFHEGDCVSALPEYQKAASLDPTLKFANNPNKFRNQMNKCAAGAATGAKIGTSKPNSDNTLVWVMVFIGVVSVIGVIIYINRRRQVINYNTYETVNNTSSYKNDEPTNAYRPPYYDSSNTRSFARPGSPSVVNNVSYPTANAGSSGSSGSNMGVRDMLLGGVIGYELGKAGSDSSHHSSSNSDNYSDNYSNNSSNNSSSNNDNSYDLGNTSSYTPSSSDSDSWSSSSNSSDSSSSYDYGSSSSSDSSSSYDYGSSSSFDSSSSYDSGS